MSHMEDLPDELLLLILQHLPTSSLVSTIPDVSLRWRQLSLDAQLWRGRTVAERWSSDASAVRFFSRGPLLESLHLPQLVGDAVLRCVADRCPSLTELLLQESQWVELLTLRAVATGLPRLRVLRVGLHVLHCPHMARVVATLMPSLETLTLLGNYDEPQLRELSIGCPSLRRLNLFAAAVRLSDLGPELLGRLRGLTLRWKSLTRAVALCAASLEELQLNCMYSNFDNAPPPDGALAEDLRTLTALTRVDLTSFRRSRILVEALLQPSLRALTLSRSSAVDNSLMLLVCRRCPLLEDLDISYCGEITPDGLSQLWTLQGLRRLNLEGLGAGAVEHLARCRGLQELNLRYWDLRSLGPGVSRLLELRNLRVLYFNAWSARNLIPWEELPEAFPDLRVLHLGVWRSPDTTLLERLKAALPKVLFRW